jgi:cation transporter-like permease
MAYLKKISDLELTVVSLKSEIAALRDDNKKYGRDSGGGASRGGTHFEHFDGDVEFGDGYTSLSTHSTTSIASSSNNNATQYAGLLKGCKTPFWASVYDRCSWLVMLLIFQSFSSIILVAYEGLLAAHSDIIFFLTMLVGAGGNAGNQAAVRAIRGIALGSLNVHTRNHFLRTEIGMAFTIACIVGIFGFLRAVLSFRTTFMETIAITTALVTIVFISIATGASLPFVLQYLRADPAHSSTTIQVIMDILGVLITCAVATVMLGTSDASTSGGGPAGTGAFTTGASVVGVTKSQGMGVVG